LAPFKEALLLKYAPTGHPNGFRGLVNPEDVGLLRWQGVTHTKSTLR